MQVKIILLKVVTDVFFYRPHVYYHSVRHDGCGPHKEQRPAAQIDRK